MKMTLRWAIIINIMICHQMMINHHRCDQNDDLWSKWWSVIKMIINRHQNYDQNHHHCDQNDDQSPSWEGNGASTLRVAGSTEKADWPLQDERSLLQVIFFFIIVICIIIFFIILLSSKSSRLANLQVITWWSKDLTGRMELSASCPDFLSVLLCSIIVITIFIIIIINIKQICRILYKFLICFPPQPVEHWKSSHTAQEPLQVGKGKIHTHGIPKQ